jgi:eukaryotic-like serine/threonine-protein kinase
VPSPTLLHARRAPGPSGAELEEHLLGRYRLIERLGTGGFGVVWRAHDGLLDREVAVKRIQLEPGADGARASREALAGARLAHPAIVSLYEACAEDDAFYLISELVHGKTLAQLISARALTDRETIQIGLALADALSHAHARGVIHRDVKPQNVLVPDRGDEPSSAPAGSEAVAKLTDFGGARLAGEDVLTRTGDVLGTLAYMAPEQSEGREAGEPADLYSLALVLYEALSGTNPVRGSTPAETARRIGRPLAPLARARRELPRSLTSSLDRALAPKPSERGTLQELRRALEDALCADDGRPFRGRRGRDAAREERPLLGGEAALQRGVAPATATAVGTGRDSPEHRPAHGPPEQAAPGRRLRLPRAVWLGCAVAVIAWQALAGRPGVSLLLLAALAPLLALPRRVGVGWMSAALAPVLGLAGLAAAYPAIAGQARRASERAALGALGYWWLVLSEPLLERRLWLGEPSGTPGRSAWEGSLTSAGVHLIAPLLGLAVLLGAMLWAAGAAVLPWLVRGRRAGLDALAATVWSVALLLGTPALDGGLSTHPSPRGLAFGAVLGAAVAVAARALRGPV